MPAEAHSLHILLGMQVTVMGYGVGSIEGFLFIYLDELGG